jgi:shikimate kinase
LLGAADKWEAASCPGRSERLAHLLAEMRAVVDPLAIPENEWSSIMQGARGVPDPLAGEGVERTPLPQRGRGGVRGPRPIVALVGHRAAGKSRLLPLVCRWTGLPGIDLDRLIEERAGRSVAALFTADPGGFRGAEREAFGSIRGPAIVATGGGFLSLHADLLRGHSAVLVPITLETYRQRLMEASLSPSGREGKGDGARPRLRPELTLDEEIAQVYAERAALHAAMDTIPLLDFLRASSPAIGGEGVH